MRLPIGYLALLLPASLVAIVAAGGCEATTDTSNEIVTDAITSPTVEIDPVDFLLSCPPGAGADCVATQIACAALPGAMQSYVVTFVDIGPPYGDPELDPTLEVLAPGYPVSMPSSPPTSCSQRVAFTRGVVGHRYRAEIDGYEQPASEIVPACSVQPAYVKCAGLNGAKAPMGNGVCTQDSDCFANGCYGRCEKHVKEKLSTVGSSQICVKDESADPSADHRVCVYQTSLGGRHMVSKSTYEPVAPRWTTRADYPCGFSHPADPGDYEKVGLADCAPLVDSGGTNATGIRVDMSALLSGLVCNEIIQVKNPDYKPDGDAGPEFIPQEIGTVTTIDVTPKGSSSGPQSVACKAPAALFEAGVAAGAQYFFDVAVHEKGSAAPTYTTTCVAVAEEGVTVLAKCVPLAPASP